MLGQQRERKSRNHSAQPFIVTVAAAWRGRAQDLLEDGQDRALAKKRESPAAVEAGTVAMPEEQAKHQNTERSKHGSVWNGTGIRCPFRMASLS